MGGAGRENSPSSDKRDPISTIHQKMKAYLQLNPDTPNAERLREKEEL
jgi:hypothetical protein